jgi:hypothetical protein
MRNTIDMAREAGFFENGGNVYGDHTNLKAFEALVRADERSVEREACAKVCEDAFSSSHAGRVVCDNLAYAIRARGTSD